MTEIAIYYVVLCLYMEEVSEEVCIPYHLAGRHLGVYVNTSDLDISKGHHEYQYRGRNACTRHEHRLHFIILHTVYALGEFRSVASRRCVQDSLQRP